MAKILLLEPNYPAKYPPLGLMKIYFYHKHIRNDEIVVFAKGKLTDAAYRSISWDRIYVSTMFTYEWDRTIESINHALELTGGDVKRIFVGGIAATLIPEAIEKETGVQTVTGLLNVHGALGYEDIGELDDCQIDSLPPDYGMLDQIDYKYEYANHYFAYTTRGCGMNCSFCAVKILEPQYIDRVAISAQIKAIRKIDKVTPKKGELRHNLLLLDNNVLRSKKLRQIINEIKRLGFHKGATFVNQKTGNTVRRFVDFNQGLDANLLTSQKAEMLGEIALKPARIAFDHIEDKEIYERAIRYCVNAGITEFSNYILFNAYDSKGKGKFYPADRPEDLYERLKLSVDLREELNKDRSRSEQVFIYSFPMRFIPLNAKDRGHVGPNWNKKYLRAIQVMLTPTRGKGVSGKSFFEAAFGRDVEEFKKFILMPESILAGRGRKPSDDSQERTDVEGYNNFLIFEWERLWERLPDKQLFIDFISENEITTKRYLSLPGPDYKKLYLLYFSPNKLLGIFDNLKSPTDIELVQQYFFKEATPLYFNLVKHIVTTKPSSNKALLGFFRCFGHQGINQLLVAWIEYGATYDAFLKYLQNLLIEVRDIYVDIDSLKVLQAFSRLGDIPGLHKQAKASVINEDYDSMWRVLKEAASEVDKLVEARRDQPIYGQLILAINAIKDMIYGRLFGGGVN